MVSILIGTLGCKESPEPSLERVSPLTGQIGDPITIKGTYLGYRKALIFGGRRIPEGDIGGDNQSIIMSVPENFQAGLQTIYLETEEGRSNELTFTVLPSIFRIDPISAAVGEEITITSNIQEGDVSVSFSEDVSAEVISQESGSIRVRVPENATSGPLTLTLASGLRITSDDVIVETGPTLTSLSTSEGWPGLVISVLGSNFLENQTEAFFTEEIPASLNIIDYNNLEVTIPENTLTGWLRIQNPYGRDSLAIRIVPAPDQVPFINDVTPKETGEGCPITITGGNFDPASTKVIFESFSGPITLDGESLQVSSRGDAILNVVPPEGATGEFKVETLRGTTESRSISFLETPVLKEIIPARNSLGGQIVLEVEKGENVRRLLFGESIVSPENGAFEYRSYDEKTGEIIATNVPVNISSSTIEVKMELAEGCFSNSVPLEVETSALSPNAPPSPNGPHTVVIPSGTGAVSYINNNWNTFSGNLEDPASLTQETITFLNCYCETPDGDILVFPSDLCEDSPEIPLCSDKMIFQSQEPVGSITGNLVKMPGWTGRFDSRYEEYDVTTMILQRNEFGDQVEFIRPDFISDQSEFEGPPGKEIILTGRFGFGSELEIDGDKNNYLNYPFERLSPTEVKFRIPVEEESETEVLFSFKYAGSGEYSDEKEYIITSPKLASISPVSGPPGTQVEIMGEFELDPPNDSLLNGRLRVLLNNMEEEEEIPYEILAENKLRITIPQDSKMGDNEIVLVYFNTNNISESATAYFEVL